MKTLPALDEAMSMDAEVDAACRRDAFHLPRGGLHVPDILALLKASLFTTSSDVSSVTSWQPYVGSH